MSQTEGAVRTATKRRKRRRGGRGNSRTSKTTDGTTPSNARAEQATLSRQIRTGNGHDIWGSGAREEKGDRKRRSIRIEARFGLWAPAAELIETLWEEAEGKLSRGRIAALVEHDEGATSCVIGWMESVQRERLKQAHDGSTQATTILNAFTEIVRKESRGRRAQATQWSRIERRLAEELDAGHCESVREALIAAWTFACTHRTQPHLSIVRWWDAVRESDPRYANDTPQASACLAWTDIASNIGNIGHHAHERDADETRKTRTMDTGDRSSLDSR